eukprot:RCo008936
MGHSDLGGLGVQLHQVVRKGVLNDLQAGVDDVLVDSDRGQGLGLGGLRVGHPEIRQHTDLRPRAHPRVHHPHLVVRQPDVVDRWVVVNESLSHRRINRVHRPVALRDAHLFQRPDPHLHNGVGDQAVLANPVADAPRGVVPQLPELLPLPQHPKDHQLQAGQGAFKVVALVLQLRHTLRHLLPGVLVQGEVAELLPQHGVDVALARHLADQHGALVANQVGADVLIGRRKQLHGVHVHPALVREGPAADEGLVQDLWGGQQLSHHPANPRQLRDRAGVQRGVPHLQHQVGQHGGQVGISTALADAVDRPLDVAAPRLHRG